MVARLGQGGVSRDSADGFVSGGRVRRGEVPRERFGSRRVRVDPFVVPLGGGLARDEFRAHMDGVRSAVESVERVHEVQLALFEARARLRLRKRIFRRNRVLLIGAWTAACVAAVVLMSVFGRSGAWMAAEIFVLPCAVLVWFWRVNDRKYAQKRSALHAFPDVDGSERHAAFTSKEPPVRRW